MIAIDAGNTRIKWGVHDATGWVARGALPTADAGRLREQAGDWPQEAQLLACNVAGASVEGEMTSALAGRFAPIRWLRSSAETCGVRNNYDEPTRLGADRWAAMIGARAKTPGACLVVCAGTATTVDWLDAGGMFRGGLILPGVRMMCGALARNTAQLPHAEGEYREEPRNTMDAIVSGCLHAQAGAIERMFARASAEGDVLCLMTGGAAHRIAPCLGIPCRMEETLVLDGLLRCVS